MKLSSYYKQQGNNVILKTDYDSLEQYEKVYISKVFMDTEIPEEPKDKSLKTEATISEYYKNNRLLNLLNVEYGGTGFYYDKAPPLLNDIEHIMPDYNLYDGWVQQKTSEGINTREFEYYNNYSIGMTTRGCIRGCKFCVNKNYKQCNLHSPVSEFLNQDRKYICCLDDNVLACKDWKGVFNELQNTNKPFQFKQGMDERLLTDEKCEIIFNQSKWIGDYIFAFDNIDDRKIIEEKLKMIRKHTNVIPKFYVFCGFNHHNPNNYTDEFWKQDIVDLFKRIEILMEYQCLPYIMKYKDYALSPYKGIYTDISRWCNQPSFFKKQSLREYIYVTDGKGRENKLYASKRYLQEFEKQFPEIATQYFEMKYENYLSQVI